MKSNNQQCRSVLIAEDDQSLSADLKSYFLGQDWEVEVASTLLSAQEKCQGTAFDLVLADYSQPDEQVISFIEEVKGRSPLTQVLVMTKARKDPVIVVEAFRNGADDLIFKPFKIDDLDQTVRKRMTEKRQTVLKRFRLAEPRTSSEDTQLVGRSTAMAKVFQLIEMVSDKDVTVLVTGESGTGKELVSRAIHQGSQRRDRPFIAINCSAIPDNLLEDELFGHVPGAFTSANQVRVGKFEAAARGTLLLDEIGDLPLPLQAKLLRVLEEKRVQKLGSNESIEVDTRIIAATNCELAERVRRKEFRADLYYRLNMVPLQLPPLRERREDLPLLATHLLKRICEKANLPSKSLSPRGLRRLLPYGWPGNVRELRNVLELAALLSAERTVLGPEDFPALSEPAANAEPVPSESTENHAVTLPEEGLDLPDYLQRLEQALILQSIERTRGNKRKAADLLSLKRTTLVAKMRRMGLLEQGFDLSQLQRAG